MEFALAGRPLSAIALWRRLLNSRAASGLMLVAFFWAVSAAAYSGFIGKWGLRDDSPRFSIDRMLDKTAERPFVYRQLVPSLANAADAIVPEALKRRLVEKLDPQPVFARTTRIADPAFRFRYVFICYVSFLALFLCLFLLRKIALEAGASQAAAVLAATSLALAFPYLQTLGGYYYDSTELLFFSLAFLFAARGNAPVLIMLALPATLNKETFFFFVPALYPLLRCSLSPRQAAVTTAAALAAAGAVNVAVEAAFAGAPGGTAQFHLISNLATYLSVSSYRQTELTYGLIGPAGASIATLLVVAAIAFRGWRHAPDAVRRHLMLAGAINLPLFLTFGYAGEWRNLSLLFVGAVVVMASAVDAVSHQPGRRPLGFRFAQAETASAVRASPPSER